MLSVSRVKEKTPEQSYWSVTDWQVLTRSLSAAGSGLSAPKSSADTSWDVCPWHRTHSRPTSSSPRSSPELSMVLRRRWRRRRRRRRQQVRSEGAEGRSRSTGDSPSTHRTSSTLIPTHEAPPGRRRGRCGRDMREGVGCVRGRQAAGGRRTNPVSVRCGENMWIQKTNEKTNPSLHTSMTQTHRK